MFQTTTNKLKYKIIANQLSSSQHNIFRRIFKFLDKSTCNTDIAMFGKHVRRETTR